MYKIVVSNLQKPTHTTYQFHAPNTNDHNIIVKNFLRSHPDVASKILNWSNCCDFIISIQNGEANSVTPISEGRLLKDLAKKALTKKELDEDASSNAGESLKTSSDYSSCRTSFDHKPSYHKPPSHASSDTFSDALSYVSTPISRRKDPCCVIQ